MRSVQPATERPNILFIVLDTVRAQSLSLYGRERNTSPTIDSIARHAMVFDRAFATAPWTLPSHSSMFTGLRSDQINVAWRTRLGDEHRTLAEVLRDNGYDTAAFSANVHYVLPAYGMDQGFSEFDYLPISWGQLVRSSWRLRTIAFYLRSWSGLSGPVGERAAPSISGSFLKWLDRPKDRPFFAFLNYMDATPRTTHLHRITRCITMSFRLKSPTLN